MTPLSEGGSNDIGNAIALCFECHAEVHLYNDKHPRGRKYLPAELKIHKDQWLHLCKKSPQILVQSLQPADGGPLSSIISELEFNSILSGFDVPFENKEFFRAISNGILSILEDSIKKEIMNTYVVIKSVNDSIRKYNHKEAEQPSQWVLSQAKSSLTGNIEIAKEAIDRTLELLRDHLDN